MPATLLLITLTEVHWDIRYFRAPVSLNSVATYRSNVFRVILELVVSVVVAVLVDHRLPEVNHSFREKCCKFVFFVVSTFRVMLKISVYFCSIFSQAR